MSKRYVNPPTEANIDLDRRLFNDVYFPHLLTIHNREVYYGGSGSGKCFGKGTQIVMYDGSLKKVEDIIVGDLLMGIDSSPRKVLDLSNGIGELYNVHQNKGIDYIVNRNHVLCLKKAKGCYGDHNEDGSIRNKRRYPENKEYEEIPVSDYLNKSARWKTNFLGYRQGVEFSEKDISISPYFLGVWLGDGTSENLSITTKDKEIVEYIYEYAEEIGQDVTIGSQKGKALTYLIKGTHHPEYIKEAWANILSQKLHEKYKKKNCIINICRKTGFSRRNINFWESDSNFNKKIEYYKDNPHDIQTDVDIISEYINKINLRDRFVSYDLLKNKHIPNNFLYNTRKNRLQLLAGIIDTDGSMSGNCYDIVQKNKELSYQIKYLANSLGLRCSIQECKKTCCNNGIIGTYYRMNISGNTHEIPVKIERKKIIKYNKNVDAYATGITITFIGSGEYFGFEVDKDHKFLLEDFTVTHNSTFIGDQKLALQMTIFPGRNLVCLRRQKTDCIKSCFPEIKNGLKKLHLLDYWIVKENPDHVMINKINGNTILFEGVDNIEDIKSIKFEKRNDDDTGDNNLTDVWYEEVNAEESQDTINELARRMRDMKVKSRIILSFNPVSRAHWLFNYVTNELPNDTTVDSLILKTTYKDNRFLPPEYGAALERTRFTNPYDYQVYALGNWGTMGETIFDKNKIQNRLDKLVNLPVRYCDFYYELGTNKLPVNDSYKLFDTSDGDIAIFKMPESKHPYVMAVDTAGEGSDFYAAQVMDNISGEQVARFKSSKNPDLCIWQIYGLAILYNYALLCPEINFDSWIIKALLLLEYPNIYRRKASVDKTYQKQEDRYGWRTGADNRSMILSDMIYWTGQYMDCINDVDTLNEMLTFTRQDKKLKGIWWGAESGEHDDLCMSWAILLQAREQQEMALIPDRKKLEGFWTRDDLEYAVESGKVDRESADEYIQKNGYYAESYDTRFKRERSNRYVVR